MQRLLGTFPHLFIWHLQCLQLPRVENGYFTEKFNDSCSINGLKVQLIDHPVQVSSYWLVKLWLKKLLMKMNDCQPHQERDRMSFHFYFFKADFSLRNMFLCPAFPLDYTLIYSPFRYFPPLLTPLKFTKKMRPFYFSLPILLYPTFCAFWYFFYSILLLTGKSVHLYLMFLL